MLGGGEKTFFVENEFSSSKTSCLERMAHKKAVLPTEPYYTTTH